MSREKQALLTHYRRRKRFLGFTCLLLALVTGLVHWMLPILLTGLLWLAHEAWGSDHLFYSPQQDHSYRFERATARRATIADGRLRLPDGLADGSTLILEISTRARFLGYFLDPRVTLNGERFDFERGCAGKRYLDISHHRAALTQGCVSLTVDYCAIAPEAHLFAFSLPDFTQRRLMIIAPHADDAELAAFGLYRSAASPLVVSITQGEAEAETLAAALTIDFPEAARLKGRLRSWDSICVPRWGGVPAGNCVQLGYYCMQLTSMRASPDTPQVSRYCGDGDIRTARLWNHNLLPGDADGAPTWNNLVADLVALIDDFRPEVIVTPHQVLDPHPDHVATTQALREALVRSAARPEHILFYANHLHDNDRWPMGPAGGGVILPPAFDATKAIRLWSISLPPVLQRDKAMALGMHHDLQGPLPAKKRLRRFIQKILAGRRWPRSGDNEYFRKAVRSREVFWLTSGTQFVENKPGEE